MGVGGLWGSLRGLQGESGGGVDGTWASMGSQGASVGIGGGKSRDKAEREGFGGLSGHNSSAFKPNTL